MSPTLWMVRLSAVAQDDYKQTLRWSRHNFGQMQTQGYKATLDLALKDLCEGPEIIGVKSRNDIYPNLYTLHVERKGRQGKHFICLQACRVDGRQVIDIVRILHDALALRRHLTVGDL